ncbi:unnamed protein product, partial [Cladocopium goreaui]
MYDDKLETAKDHICCGSCKKWNSHRRMITSGVVCFQTADEDGVIKTKYKKICARCWTAEKNLSTPKDEPKVSMMDAALKEHDSLYERQARKQVRRTTADATPKSPVSVPKAAPKSPSASVTPKASSNGGVSSTLAKMPKQTRAAPELCQRHLQMCNCEHWKVIHTFVFVRSDASLDSEPLAVLREGSLLCAAKPEEPRSSDGKWARLGSQAKVWSEITSDRPDFVALGREVIPHGSTGVNRTQEAHLHIGSGVRLQQYPPWNPPCPSDAMAEADDDAGQKKNNKRDALRSTQAVPFSMFDPIVAFEAINSNWINVPEVAKLGIQAAHKKIGLAREERLELQRAMDNLQKQFRGMQEHHVQQMNAQTSRVDFLERSTK